MAKTDAMIKIPVAIEYPRHLLVAYVDHDTPDQCLLASVDPAGIDIEGRTVKVARYVLVGTGVIQNSAAQYVEHVAA